MSERKPTFKVMSFKEWAMSPDPHLVPREKIEGMKIYVQDLSNRFWGKDRGQ